ncbi:uncharacterized protein GIQ15_04279 [Arthroderma uncinatum]|uniref:uncharacterized protein n=1 Tax=Arthroderma uncinatum TaxID=74035 RepID=UPI00144AC896|nr:uncharacterized protein GIQ15_04279 [Arthroderma uncinatum]KAF3481520.1 hypothetical protein GIQ15_04279 [Arthroderma uncinatum]
MEQQQGLVQRGHSTKLDMAALAVTEVLSRNGLKHGFFGGYAVSVFGGERLTQDVDVIVGEDAQAARQQLLAGDGNFYMIVTNKLKFRLEGQDIDIEVELLRGGKDQPMKLPDINTALIILQTHTKLNTTELITKSTEEITDSTQQDREQEEKEEEEEEKMKDEEAQEEEEAEFYPSICANLYNRLMRTRF